MRARVFRKILVAVESPEKARRAVDLAILLASANQAELVILHVLPLSVPLIPAPGFGVPYQLVSAQYEGSFDKWRRRDERWVGRLAAAAEENGLKVKAEIALPDIPVAQEVVKRAEEEGVDLIVTGTTDATGLKRLVQGSVSAGVIRHAKCPVLVAR